MSEGHTLIVPGAHVPAVFDLSGAEQSVVWALIAEVRDTIRSRLTPQPEGSLVSP